MLTFFFALGCSSGDSSDGAATTDDGGDIIEADDTEPDETRAIEPSEPDFPPPPEGEGYQLTLRATVQPGEEAWVCEVKAMPNTDSIANVSWVDVRQNEGMHHTTLSTLGFNSAGKIEHGMYDCNELYGDNSLMEDQIMFYGNQGTAEDTMHLPDGVAAQIPPGLDVIHEMQFVNAGTKPVELYNLINAWTVPGDEVEEGIWGGSVRDENIHVPPATDGYSEWSRCLFNEDVEILFLASHMHALGVKFEIAPFNGKEVGEVMYTNDDWHIPLITQYDPPMVVKAGEGFEWKCTWDNPTDQEITYGNTAENEMCNLAVVHTPFSLTAACEVVETSDGVLWKPGE